MKLKVAFVPLNIIIIVGLIDFVNITKGHYMFCLHAWIFDFCSHDSHENKSQLYILFNKKFIDSLLYEQSQSYKQYRLCS